MPTSITASSVCIDSDTDEIHIYNRLVTFAPELHARAAAELRAQASIIGARSVDAQFAANPGLAERFGPRGVEASLRDARSNVEHLAEAIALGDPQAFAAYVTWLQGVLVAAHVPAPVLAAHRLGNLPIRGQGRALGSVRRHQRPMSSPPVPRTIAPCLFCLV